MSRRAWIYFVALGVIWGLPYLLIKIAVREVSPPLLVFIRTGGGALLLLPLAAARHELVPALRRWRAVLVYSVAEMGVPWLVLFDAERHIASSLAGLLVASVPLVSAVLGWATGTERINLRRGAGLVVGIGGVAVLVGSGVGSTQLSAVLSMFVVVAGYALGPWLIGRYLSDLRPLGVVALSFACCALAYAPAAALNLPTRPLAVSVIESVTALTVICTAVAFVLMFALVFEVQPVRSTLITYINPAVAVALGVGALGEPFEVATGVGFALILAGCFLAGRAVAPLRGP